MLYCMQKKPQQGARRNARRGTALKNLILKITEGELFRFYDTEERESVVIGSSRKADICIRSVYIQPQQLRLTRENGVWFAEELGGKDPKCVALLGGKPFRRPKVRLDGELALRRTDAEKKEKDGELCRITPVRQINRRKEGPAFDLTQKTVTTFGSGDCDVRIDSPLVSAKHFFIVFDGADCYIEDAHSLHGTYVNNRRIKRQKLIDYDRISVPTAAYVFYRNKLLHSTAAGGIRIDAVNVSKKVNDRNARGKIPLVTEASFRIEAGEFVAVVGGSGAGKSTLLDCLNGMRPATEGKIYYDGNDYYENLNSYRSVIGYVPQKDILHEDLTLADALRYTARLRTRADLSKEELAARVAAAVADVHLQGKEHLRISSLSGGQKKRVSIAMELLSDPKVIFLDEPTSGLSPDLDLGMMELLKELSKKGRTIVAVTHAMENLDKCDKVLFLGRGGRVCYFGEAAGAFRWFNRRSYSRIFLSLTEEKTCEEFARKYRSDANYKKLYAAFCTEYGAGCIAPPVEREEIARRNWEAPPKALPVQGAQRRAEEETAATTARKTQPAAESAPLPAAAEIPAGREKEKAGDPQKTAQGARQTNKRRAAGAQRAVRHEEK